MVRATFAGGLGNGAAEIFARNAVSCSGDGKPLVVFGHGYGGDQSVWDPVVSELGGDVPTLRFDYVGSGASDLSAYDPERYDSLHGYAKDLIEVIDAAEARDVVFVGHSVSGMIGALAAIERPDLFHCLIMVCPSPRYVDDGEYRGGFSRDDVLELLASLENNQGSWARNLAPALTARPDLPEVTEQVRAKFAAIASQVATHFARVTFLSDVRHRLAEIPVPCVILQSQGDLICPPHIGRYLAEHIPDSRLVELASAGHFVHLTAPTLIVNEIRACL